MAGTQNTSIDAVQAAIPAIRPGRSGFPPPVEHQFKPGHAPTHVRKTAGATVREWINELANRSADELRKIYDDTKAPIAKRSAALRCLRVLDHADAADFEDVIEGTMTLSQAKAKGLPTSAVKKIKRNAHGELEIEFANETRADTEFLIEQTDGKPTQTVKGDAAPQLAVQIIVPGSPDNYAALPDGAPCIDVPALPCGEESIEAVGQDDATSTAAGS